MARRQNSPLTVKNRVILYFETMSYLKDISLRFSKGEYNGT